MNEKLLILGASGKTGRLALKLALEKKYEITILVRNPDKLDLKDSQIKIIKGSPTNIADVRKAMTGCNSVLSFLAALPEKDMITLRKLHPLHILKNSIKNTIKVMEEQNVKRIIVMSSIGAGNSAKYLPWIFKMIFKLTNMPIVLKDHSAQEKLLTESNLDWTIVRSVGLTENAKSKKLVIDFENKPRSFKIRRISVAQFFLDILDSKEYFKKTMIISEK